MPVARIKLCAHRVVALVGLILLAPLNCGGNGSNGNHSANAPLRILMTNDDGVGAVGLDAMVQALAADPLNQVIVCAPNGNRSGSGDETGPSARCGDLTVMTTTTLGGYAATAINGCPADAVNYAFAMLYPAGTRPQLVIAGINEGQNVSLPITTRLSGTVGAARTAARQGVPALAASQGIPASGPYDYPAGVAAVLSWLDANRDALQTGAATTRVENLNVPTCSAGTAIRGTIADIPLATSSAGFLDPQNCASTVENPQTDVEGLLNGFITLSSIPLANS